MPTRQAGSLPLEMCETNDCRQVITRRPAVSNKGSAKQGIHEQDVPGREFNLERVVSLYSSSFRVELLWLAAFAAILAPNCGCGATTRESAYQDFDYRHNTAHVAMSSWRARTAARVDKLGGLCGECDRRSYPIPCVQKVQGN